MTPQNPSAEVLNIQLTEFTYNPEYDFTLLDEVEIKVQVLSRAPPGKDQFDILVRIAYHDKKTSQSVLSTSCVTNYALIGMVKGVDAEDGRTTVDIPGRFLYLMRIEAVAHARALIATQAASTPFGKTFVALSIGAISQAVEEEVELANVDEPVIKEFNPKSK